jgi:hypothetical protein
VFYQLLVVMMCINDDLIDFVLFEIVYDPVNHGLVADGHKGLRPIGGQWT